MRWGRTAGRFIPILVEHRGHLYASEVASAFCTNVTQVKISMTNSDMLVYSLVVPEMYRSEADTEKSRVHYTNGKYDICYLTKPLLDVYAPTHIIVLAPVQF